MDTKQRINKPPESKLFHLHRKHKKNEANETININTNSNGFTNGNIPSKLCETRDKFRKNESNGFTNANTQKNDINANANALEPQKSLVVAYVLWFFGGYFGLHHFYLHRDRHAFVWCCTLGGYFGIGWLSEIFLIPEYVRDANENPIFIESFIKRLQAHRRPPYSAKRFLGKVLVAYLFGQLCALAIPQTIVGGIDWSILHWCIPFFIAIGVWTVGNIGRERGVLWHCLLAAFIVYPARYLIYDETYSLLFTALTSAFIFDTYSKQWLRTQPVRRGLTIRSLRFTGAICIYLSFWGCHLYFNGTINDDGSTVPVHEAFHNFLASAWWTDLKQALRDTYAYGQHHGWYETLKEIFESMDVDGERNSYKVLGVSGMASQAEITAAYRKLSKENHPDKVKDEAQRAIANQRFIEIQQAYNVLSKIKSNRRRKNTKYNDGESIVL